MSSQIPAQSSLIVRQLGRRPYQPVWDAMKAFTDNRTSDTPDEFWVVEHDPVYTQAAGKAEHLLNPGNIPVVQSDRGGQVTYHGPGQLVLYVLVDVRRCKFSVRELVTALETAIINTLAKSDIRAYAKADAPGVYVKMTLAWRQNWPRWVCASARGARSTGWPSISTWT